MLPVKAPSAFRGTSHADLTGSAGGPIQGGLVTERPLGGSVAEQRAARPANWANPVLHHFSRASNVTGKQGVKALW